MNEKKNERKEEMRKENNTEVTDFEDLRAENEEISTDSDKEQGKKESETKKDIDENEKESEKKDSGTDSEEEKKESETVKDSEKDEKESETEKDSEEEKKESETAKDSEEKKESAAVKDSEEEKKESETKKDSEEKKESAAVKDSEEEKKESETKKDSDKEKKEIAVPQNGKSKKGLWIALASVFGVILIVYIAGFAYFSGHFYQDVAVNGVNVSGMNKESAKQVLDNFYKDYKLTLVLIDGSKEVINGKDISAAITLKDEFSRCFQEQEAFLWFVKLFEHYDFTIGADSVYDEAALAEVYASLDILKKGNMEKPEDAYVGVVDGKFAIVEEVMGTTIIEETFRNSVEEGLSTVMAEVNLVDHGCYKLPSVYGDSEELKAELNAKNEYAENDIKLQLDDLTLEPGMELYEDVLEKKGDQYEVSDQKVKKYVEDLAKEYDTLDTDRTFTTSWNDRKITTHGETLGYVMNKEQTAQALSRALKAKKPATVEASFDSKGYTLQGENDIGDTYIEVNLSEQHVYAYKNGRKIAEGDCVSGNEAAGHGTCIGLYAIQGKQSPAVLRGEKKPVTKTVTKKKKGKKVKVETTTYEYDYESPVTFWMPFNGGIGLHDAAGWRSQYGGSIYYYSGSHGCVNLPYDLASTLYENFEIGDPVIVYFWDNENRK
ncbi:MAG: L,D-transpeptidase/peptidoglycan binding protein [Clostridium sp.]|nr:L,D-transpeptidase/peptidoglycan binding protein [Clostridium sp.]